MTTQFANDIHLGWVDEEAVLLDLPRDRFFLASPRLRGAIMSLENAGIHPADPALLELLKANGLSITAASSLPGTNQDTAQFDLPESRRQSVPLLLLGRALLEQGRAAVALKSLPLRAIINDLRRRKSALPASAADIARLYDYAAAFQRSAKYFPSDRKCLRRSIALARHALRQGYEVTLFFGVSLRPFAAHCWVQHGEMVLNDSLDSIRRYTPVLVV